MATEIELGTTYGDAQLGRVLALKHESRILGHSSHPVCVVSMMEPVRLCNVWPMENWLGSSLNQAQGWTPFENPTLVL